jgi:hypothetical protein
MNFKRDEVESGLKRKGFEPSDNDHSYFTLYIEGKKEASTHISLGDNFDVRADEIGFMAKQLGISNQDFRDLVNCPLSTEGYIIKRKEYLNNSLRILKKG